MTRFGSILLCYLSWTSTNPPQFVKTKTHALLQLNVQPNLQLSNTLFWSQYVVLLKSDLDVQQTQPYDVEHQVGLSSNLKCD